MGQGFTRPHCHFVELGLDGGTGSGDVVGSGPVGKVVSKVRTLTDSRRSRRLRDVGRLAMHVGDEQREEQTRQHRALWDSVFDQQPRGVGTVDEDTLVSPPAPPAS
jgi:hypothetical protein